MEPQETPAEPLVGTKKWYESKGVIGALVTTAALVAEFAGFNIDAALNAEITDQILAATAMGGAIYALIGRVVATKEISG